MFNRKQKIWSAIDRLRADYTFLRSSISSNIRANNDQVTYYEHKFIRIEQRLLIIEESISCIARTLDANHIQKACSHCGQVKREAE